MTTEFTCAFRHLLKRAGRLEVSRLSDGQLLERFIEEKDTLAFEGLMHRFGPKVLAVCLRQLNHFQDAEDAFQATFLIFVKKATSVSPRNMVANWLCGVAFRVASKIKSSNHKRHFKELQTAFLERSSPSEELYDDCESILKEELESLPEKYRTAVTMCELEGKSRREAAQRLGIREGTLSSRLAAARKALGKKLSKRGIYLSVGAAAVHSPAQAGTAVPAALLTATLKAAMHLLSGQSLTTCSIPSQVAAATTVFLSSTLFAKLKLVAAVVLAVGLFSYIASNLFYASTVREHAHSGENASQKQQKKSGRSPSAVKSDANQASSSERSPKKADGPPKSPSDLPVLQTDVQTFDARFTGKMVIEKDSLLLGGRKVDWSEVVHVLVDSPIVATHPQRVHFKNGETWNVEVLGLSGSTLEIRANLIGDRKLDVAMVSGIEFTLQSDMEAMRKTGVLYRTKGEEVGGKLLAIDLEKVTIDNNVIGELDLPRRGLGSYYFALAKSSTNVGEDEVFLVDGSMFRGRLNLETGAPKLEHAVLGPVALPAKLIHAVVRHPDRMLDLVDCLPQSIQVASVLGEEKLNRIRKISARGGESATYIKGLLLEPKTTIVYKIPGKDGAKGKLRTFLTSHVGAKGDIRVTVRSHNKTLLALDLGPTAHVEAVSLDVQAGQELEFTVDFGDRLRFPCGAVLCDPHVVWSQP